MSNILKMSKEAREKEVIEIAMRHRSNHYHPRNKKHISKGGMSFKNITRRG